MAITAALDPVLLLLTRQHALIAGRTEQLPRQMGARYYRSTGRGPRRRSELSFDQRSSSVSGGRRRIRWA